jgi:hypothetical protein
LRWFSINLGLLVAGAILASLNPADVSNKQVVQGFAAMLFFLGLAVSILLANRRWDKIWYSGRAVAESVKSLTWKFVAGADPFPTTLDEASAVDGFVKALNELLQENRHLASAFTNEHCLDDQVTESMRGWRRSAIEVVRDVYLAQRVKEQQSWYASNSNKNKTNQRAWFVLLVLFQGGAGVASVYLALAPTSAWSLSGVLSTLASATIAWGQVKRFQELAQAYGLAAQELSLISTRARNVGTREQLSRFVNDAETAISREHSTWIARREASY